MQHKITANFLEREGRTEEAAAARNVAMRHRQEHVLTSSAMEHLKFQIALQQATGMEISAHLPAVMKHIELCRLVQPHLSAKRAQEEVQQNFLKMKREQQQRLHAAQQDVNRHNMDVEKLAADVEALSTQVCARRHFP
jgi:hypothetical protein